MGPAVRTNVSLLSIFSQDLPEPAPVAGDSDAGGGDRLSAMDQRIPEVQQSGAPARTRRLTHHPGPVEMWPEVARSIHPVHHDKERKQAGCQHRLFFSQV